MDKKAVIFDQEMIDTFIVSQDISNKSRQIYKTALKNFFAWLERKEIERPTKETILRYKQSLDTGRLALHSRAVYVIAVRQFFKWAGENEMYKNVARDVKAVKVSSRRHSKHALTLKQVKKLLASIDKKSTIGLRDFAMINLLLRTGLRLSEMIQADMCDIDQEHGQTVLWVRGKGRHGKDSFVVLAPAVLDPIHEYLRMRNAHVLRDAFQAPQDERGIVVSVTTETAHPACPSKLTERIWEERANTASVSKHVLRPLEGGHERALFCSHSRSSTGSRLDISTVSRMIKKYLKAIGLDSKKITAHSLRHTFGVLSIQAGASLYDVQLAMRHTSPLTTEVYLRDIQHAKRLAGAPEFKLGTLLDD